MWTVYVLQKINCFGVIFGGSLLFLSWDYFADKANEDLGYILFILYILCYIYVYSYILWYLWEMRLDVGKKKTHIRYITLAIMRVCYRKNPEQT